MSQPAEYAAFSLCSRSHGASEEELARLEDWLGQSLPPWYRALLSWSDGMEGFVSSGAYVVFWSTGAVAGLNAAYQSRIHAPGLMLIGTDGGAVGYAIDVRTAPSRIVTAPLLGLSHGACAPIGEDLASLLTHLASGV